MAMRVLVTRPDGVARLTPWNSAKNLANKGSTCYTKTKEPAPEGDKAC